jgi:hypothetical protein
LQPDIRMPPRAWKVARVGLIILSAFLVGGASAEVAVRTHGAIARARAEREVGAAGQLVALELRDQSGEVVARPRIVAPAGKAAEVVLHEPGSQGAVRVAFRVSAVREATGDIALAYALWVPGHEVQASGTVQLTPGVEQQIALGDGALVATWLAVPVPSAALDAFLESEAAQRPRPRRSS